MHTEKKASRRASVRLPSFQVNSIARNMPTYPDEADVAALGRLASGGVDLSQPQQIEFHIAPRDQNAAVDIQRALSQLGYCAELEYDEGELEEDCDSNGVANEVDEYGPSWTVTVEIRIVPTLEEIGRLQAEFDRIAEPFGGHSDGWGALIDSRRELAADVSVAAPEIRNSIEVKAYIVTYNAMGGDPSLVRCVDFLLVNAPSSFGSAIKEVEIYAHCQSRGRPLKTLGFMRARFRERILKLPNVSFHRKARRFVVSYLSQLPVPVGMFGENATRLLSPRDFATYCQEFATALLMIEKRLKPTDDFDMHSLRTHLQQRLSSFPKDDER